MGKIVKKKQTTMTHSDLQQDGLRLLEDELYTGSLAVVGGTFDFAELDEKDLDKMPEGWIDSYGEKEAKKRHRIAKAGWMPNKEAPVALTLATKVLTGIVRARATEKAGPKQLNINMVSMTAPLEELEVLDVEEE
jgi:hypothetical protein